MRKFLRLEPLAAVMLSLLASCVEGNHSAAPAGTQETEPRASPSDGTLTSVSSAQLSFSNLALSPAQADPATSQQAAELIATDMFRHQVRETALARCTLMGGPEPRIIDPCWAVSLMPPGQAQYILRGPDSEYNQSHPIRVTMELVLVDARSNEFVRAFSSNAPTDVEPVAQRGLRGGPLIVTGTGN